ncbi:MAG: TonB-dependent receptor [Flavobacteriaceae bacterium]|jgi:outer membrane receptor for ferrienterochelin and colicins|nr:TonB-dependent receptor [Flavobacteriaceae bacterium]
MRFNLIFILLNLQLVSAQDFFVRGKVYSEGQPLSSAFVYVKGSNTGVTTDINGQFSIYFSNIKNPKLLISYLGHKTQIKKIVSNTNDLGIIELELEDSLEEIVISGTLKPVSKLDSPVPVEVYNHNFFRANPSPSIFEALENVNGIRPQLNCNVCNTGDIHINGQEGSYTMVLIDGLPIVSGLSTVYGLSGIPQSLIERIEIVKGPASTLYGSEAIGGVINLITKLPENTSSFSIDSFLSGWGEINTDLGYKYALSKKVKGVFGLNYFNYSNPIDNNGDGFTDLTLQDRISIFNKFTFGRKFSIASRFVYEDRWGGQMGWRPKHRGGSQIYGESIYTSRFELFGNHKFNNNLSFQFSFNDHNHNSVYGTTLFNADQTIGFGQLVWNKNIKKNELLIGIAYRLSYYHDDTKVLLDRNKAHTTHLPGVFIQNQINFNPNNTLLLGLRYDQNSIHGNILTPRLNYKVNNGDKSTILRFSAGTGYRVAQVFTEDHAALTGAREVVFLDDLDPEKSWNTNLNYIQKFYLEQGLIIDLDLSLFKTHFSNKIIPDYDTDPNKIIYNNLSGKSVSNGISINANLLASGGLRINLGATFIDTFAEENGTKTTPYLTERFQGVWKLEKKWRANNLILDLTGTTVGALKLPTLGELDPRADISTPFSIVNLQLTKSWNNSIESYGGIKNILNFTPPKNSIARAFDPFDRRVNFDDSGSVLATTNNPYALTFDPSYVYASNQGIRFFLGLRWKYN